MNTLTVPPPLPPQPPRRFDMHNARARACARMLDAHANLRGGSGGSGGKCLECNRPMTWADQRVQYGRLMKRGVPREGIKAMLPRCQKGVTRMLAEVASPPPPGT